MFTADAAVKIVKLHNQLAVSENKKCEDQERGLICLLKKKGCKLPQSPHGTTVILARDFLKLNLGTIAEKAIVNRKYVDYSWVKSRYTAKYK